MAEENDEKKDASIWQLFKTSSFEIGGEDQLADLSLKYQSEPVDTENKLKFEKDWNEAVSKIKIRSGTLLKTDTVSFLLGAGASKECGGVLIGKMPLEIEKTLLGEGIIGETNTRVRRWLIKFYLSVAVAKKSSEEVPKDRQEILDRRAMVMSGIAAPLPVNLEKLLSLLYIWRASIAEDNGRLRLDGEPPIQITASEIDECIIKIKGALGSQCILPKDSQNPKGFWAYQSLLRKILTRPLNLKRTNIFTLNYDTLIEQASDAEGIVLLDGFVGSMRRIFRPDSYDQDLYFPAETTEGRVHRLDRVLHLYKLHGSTTWIREDPAWDNPYGAIASNAQAPDEQNMLIYPTPAKYGEILGMPYSELFRRFAVSIVRPQSTLFILGYGFGDEHVNAIIRQAILVPSFTLVIADPKPTSDFVRSLKERKDSRTWILCGETFGSFSGFVDYVLPDLSDEDIRKKVIETYRALLQPDLTSGGKKENG